MGMLQERHHLTEQNLATHRHDAEALRSERDHLANQVRRACRRSLSMLRVRLHAAGMPCCHLRMLGCCCRGLQVHELGSALSDARAELGSAQAECERLKQLHSQVKTALQSTYSTQREQQKQVSSSGR